MFVKLKTGFDIERGPSWIGWVELNRTWTTASVHGLVLHRFQDVDSNFYDHETGDWYWLSGPKCDRTDARCGPRNAPVDEDARDAYEAS